MAHQQSYDITIPALGDGHVDCQLTQWLIAVGDFVKEGEPILILETEKTAIEIPAPADGTLAEVYVFEGEEVIESERVGIIRGEAYDDEEAAGGFDAEKEDEEYADDEEEEDDFDDDDDDDYDDDDDDYDDDDEDDDEEEEESEDSDEY